jgi:hypothetical protein
MLELEAWRRKADGRTSSSWLTVLGLERELHEQDLGPDSRTVLQDCRQQLITASRRHAPRR